MKKSMVVLCGNYYPSPSPTGLCTKRYLELVSEEYDIDIICLSQNGESGTVTEDGFNIHTLADKHMCLEYKTKGNFKKFIHLVGAVQIKFSVLGNMKWFAKAALKKMVELEKSRKIDIVFTVCSPFAAHIAGCNFKKNHPNTILCLYTVDPYSSKYRIRPFFCSLDKLIQKEKEVFSQADVLMLSEEVYNTRKELYSDCKNCTVLPYMLPMVKPQINTEGIFEKSVVNCVYAGRFYKDIRNPEYMLSVFSKADKKIVLHLYSVGCEDIVDKCRSDNIIVHGIVSQEEIQKVYAAADILIGVGNASKDFLPSKTFEYIVNLKPVVYFNYADISNEVLEKYPCALQFSNTGDITEAAEKLMLFCESSVNEVINQQDISNIYFKNSKENIKSILLGAFSL